MSNINKELIPGSLEIAQATVKKMLQCEREYRCEVSDPWLRIKKLEELWEYARFMTERAHPDDMASIVRDLLNYQMCQIHNTMHAQTIISGNSSADIANQQLTVLNAIFEIVCRISRSTQQATIERASFEEEYQKRLKEGTAQEASFGS